MDQNFQSQVRTAPTINSNSIILKTILSKTVRIEKNLKDRIKGQITTQRAEKQDKKKLKDILKEEDKKKKLSKPKLFQKVKNVTPKTGIIDSITNFLVFTFFGWFFTNTQKHLPKLLGIVNLLKGATDGIGWLTRGILDALSAFIGAGYKVYDTIKGKTDEIKSKPVQEKFDSVTKALDDNFNDLLKFFNDVNSIAEKVPQKPSPNNTPSSLPVKGAASGAYIAPTRGGSPTNKPVSRQLKTPSIPKKPKKTNIPEGRIGKDVGGEKVIREFYGSPKVGVNNIRPKGGPIRKTPVDVVSNISKTLKGRNSLFGDISSIGSEVAMGKRPNKDVYRNAAKDVVYLAQFIANNQQDQLKSAVLGMATGGRVTPISRQKINQANIVDLVENVIRTSVEKRVSEALNSLRSPMSFVRNQAQKNRGGFGRPDVSFDANGTPYFDGGYGMPGGGYGAPGGGYGLSEEGYSTEPPLTKIEMKGFSNSDVLILGRIIQAESGSEDNIGKAAVMNVILNRYRAIKSGAATPSQFGITGKRSKDVTIADIVYARNGREFQPVRDGALNRVTNLAGQNALSAAIKAGGNDPQKLKEILTKNGKSKEDAEYVVRSVGFYNPSITSSENVPFPTRTVAHGRHGFQQSADVKLRGPLGRVDALTRVNLLGVELAGKKGFKTGLRTGPEGRIGAGAAFHIDAKIHKSLSPKDRVALVDSMALAYASEGKQMVFSGSGTGTYRRIWNVDAPFKEKLNLLNSQIDAHSHSNFMREEGFLPFDYYALSKKTTDPYHKSGEYANIMAPVIPGGTYEYGQGMGYGRHLFLRDKNGRILFMTGHGYEGIPSPKDLGKRFKFDEIPVEQVLQNIQSSNLPFAKPLITPKDNNIGALGKSDGFMQNSIFTTTNGNSRQKVESFSNELRERLKKTKKDQFIDVIHMGERFSLKNIGDNRFKVFSSNRNIKDDSEFGRDILYAIATNLPYGEIKKKEKIQYVSEEDNIPEKMREIKRRNQEKFDKKFRPTSLKDPTPEQLDSRIGNTGVGEKFDIVYKGERFTIKRIGSNAFETYGKNGRIPPGELSMAMAANVPYTQQRKENKMNGVKFAIGSGMIATAALLAGTAALPVALGVGAVASVGAGYAYGQTTRRTGQLQGRGTGRKMPAGLRTPTKRPITTGQQQGRGTGRKLPKAKTSNSENKAAPSFRPSLGGVKRFLGRKQGGLIGNYNAISSYASYEGYGGIAIVAIQPMMIQQPIPIKDMEIMPVPFPVSSGVNNISNNRA